MAMHKSNIYTITGASGLVGAHLSLTLLQNGHMVKALASKPSSVQKLRSVAQFYPGIQKQHIESIDWHFGSVSDEVFVDEFIADSRFVFHCAGVVDFHPRSRHQVMEVNRQGTRNIVNACLYHHVERLISVSSVAAVGKMVNSGQITEEDKWPLAKGSVYAWSKTQGELEVWRGFHEGLNGNIVNPSVILGPGDWNDGSLKLFSRIMQGLNRYPSGGTGFVDVHDVVAAMIRLMDDVSINHERFIINGANLTYKEFFELVHQTAALNLNLQAISNPQLKLLGYLSCIAQWLGFKGGIPLENARSAQRIISYSADKFLLKSGMKFISIEKTINDLVKAYGVHVIRNHS